MTLADYLVDRIGTAIAPLPVDDARPEPAPRHVTFYADEPMRMAGDVAHTSNLLTGRFQCTYTAEGDGAYREQVQWMQRKVRGVLVDHVPAVDGFVWSPIELETTIPAKPDPDSTTFAIFAVDTFVVRGASV